MSQYPARHPYPRPFQQTTPTDYPRDCAFLAEWLGHVQAGRIGTRIEPSEEVRAIREANERLICGDGRLGIW